MNLEKIAEEIKLELHDKHMMYIDGEDSATHRYCKQLIWRVIKAHFDKYQKNSVVLINRFEADSEADHILNRPLTDDEWERITSEIHQEQNYFDNPYIHMIDVITDIYADEPRNKGDNE